MLIPNNLVKSRPYSIVRFDVKGEIIQKVEAKNNLLVFELGSKESIINIVRNVKPKSNDYFDNGLISVENDVEITNFETDYASSIKFNAMAGETALIHLNLFTNPYWVLSVNDVVTTLNSYDGYISFEIPAGKSVVKLSYKNNLMSFAKILQVIFLYGVLAVFLCSVVYKIYINKESVDGD